MRIAACFDILCKGSILILAMSTYRCAGQSVDGATSQLTCHVNDGGLFQSGHQLLKGDIIHIDANGKPGESYVIAVFPQYRLQNAPGNNQGWREFSVTQAYENTGYFIRRGRQKIVCSWAQTPLLGTADVSATLFVPYDAISTSMDDGFYEIRYLVTLEQNGNVLQRSENIISSYKIEVKNRNVYRKKYYVISPPEMLPGEPPAP